MMTKKEKQELATIVAQAVVEAMKATATKPTSANKSRNTKPANEGKKTKSSKKLGTDNKNNWWSDQPSEQALLLEAVGKKGRGSKTETTKYSMKLADYEPKKVDGFYKWGKKTDTIKSRNYRAMQIAYCYAVATKGQAISSDECFKMNLEVDFTEGGAYAKAKAEFKKKYAYTKISDR